MSVAAASDVFAARSEFHGDGGFVDEFSRMRSNDVNSEDSICGFVGEYLNEAISVSRSTSATVGGEAEASGFVFDSRLLQSVLIGTGRCNFRLSVNDGGNCAVVDMTVTCRHLFDARNSFFFRFVSQHRSTDHIAYSVDVCRTRLVTRVDLNKTTRIGPDSGIFKAETVGTWLPPHGNEDSITGDRFGTIHLNRTRLSGGRD